MGVREERERSDQTRQDLGICQMQVEKLRAAIRDALHLGVAGDTSGAGRVLLTALLGAPASSTPPPPPPEAET